jgi:prepilin signal peptidase PulO-like enzyme (type II secretory pathway)
MVCLALAACWCSDVEFGIVPDEFTLIPIVLIMMAAVWSREWWFVASGFILFVPFAAAALYTKGYGMGWGDVKLAALGGLVLGAPAALLLFTAACVAAVLLNRKVGDKAGPIAFGPYLAAAIGLALPLGVIF